MFVIMAVAGYEVHETFGKKCPCPVAFALKEELSAVLLLFGSAEKPKKAFLMLVALAPAFTVFFAALICRRSVEKAAAVDLHRYPAIYDLADCLHISFQDARL